MNRVLVIDDDRALCSLIKEFLEPEFQVESASRGDEGARRAQDDEFSDTDGLCRISAYPPSVARARPVDGIRAAVDRLADALRPHRLRLRLEVSANRR